MGVHDLWLFCVAGVLLNITPGPDMALIIARGTQQGARAGMIAALGVGAGAFIHIAAASIGISTLIVASSVAFTVLKWIGALYLTYLGVQMLRASFNRQESQTAVVRQPPPPVAPSKIFLQGVLTNALNPKVAIFFLAFLPQFVDRDAPSKVSALIMLGVLFDAVGTTWNVIVAWFAGRLAASKGYGQLRTWLERTIGTIFVGFGIKLALTERP